MIPTIFRRSLPASLLCVDAPVDQSELDIANSIRKRYELADWAEPYMVDVVRAFRILAGQSIYVEVGTRDKGNLAWVASKLPTTATLIDIDIERFGVSEKMLREDIVPREYHCITGDSISLETLVEVKKALGGRHADVVFCDSSHMYDHSLAEFELYFPLIRPGGYLMFHDAFWEGNSVHKGKAQAMRELDRMLPVYCVFMNEPLHRFIPRSEKTDVWGGVSIIMKPKSGYLDK
jgi:predicted O-methyltransferase YrrM